MADFTAEDTEDIVVETLHVQIQVPALVTGFGVEIADMDRPANSPMKKALPHPLQDTRTTPWILIPGPITRTQTQSARGGMFGVSVISGTPTPA